MNFNFTFGNKQEAVETRDFTLRDPAFAEYLGIGATTDAGVHVTQEKALGLTAVFSAVNLLSSLVAALPLKTYRNTDEGRVRVNSWLDNPCPGMTPFEFKQLLMLNLLLDGNFYGLNLYGGAGQILGLAPIHPSLVSVKWDEERQNKIFTVSIDGEQREYTPLDVTHIMGLSLDGLTGVSPITACRNAIGTALAGESAAGRMYQNGFMLGGLITTKDEDLEEDEARQIKADLNNRAGGVKNAGDWIFINRQLDLSPLSMSAEDAQFIESREFQIEEIARLYRVPKVLLATDGASTWGSGIAELNRGLHKYTLIQYTTPIEEKLSQLLASPRFVEFDFKGLLQGSPREEIELLALQVETGLLTLNEARAVINMPPLEASESTTEVEN